MFITATKIPKLTSSSLQTLSACRWCQVIFAVNTKDPQDLAYLRILHARHPRHYTIVPTDKYPGLRPPAHFQVRVKSVRLPACLSACLSICLSVCPFCLTGA
jgi:hypothetical protein